MHLLLIVLMLVVAIPAFSEEAPVDHIIETRAEFFERLDLDLPELAGVREAVEAGDIVAAEQAYLDFFRDRPFDHVSFRDFGDRNPDYHNRYADEAVALKITEYGTFQFEDPIDWRQPGMVTVCRFPQLQHLIPAFYHTGDPQYAEAMLRDFRSYLDAWPMSDAKDISAQWLVNSRIDPEANPWSPVMVTHRTLRWLEALRYLRGYEGLDAGLLVDVVARMVEDIEWVLPQIETLRMDHNFAFAMIKYSLFTSQLLAEFDRSGEWNARSRELFGRWMDEYYYPDGGPRELTLAYGSSVVGQTNTVIASLRDSEQAADLVETGHRATLHMVGLVRPDLLMPAYGDLESRGNNLVRDAAEIYGMEWAQHIRTGGDEGAAPPFTSFPPDDEPHWTGYFAMRSDWTPDARFLFVDGGIGGSSHRHADKLSIEVSAFGGNFIIDPGTATYHDTEDSRRYNLRHGFLHNAITVDGVDQGYLPPHATEPLETIWRVEDGYDLFEASYDFSGDGVEVTHTRRIVFVRPHLWLLTDTLSGEGTHFIERNFQSAAGSTIDVGENSQSITAENGAVLRMFNFGPRLSAEVVTGETEYPGSTIGGGQVNSWVNGGRGWSSRLFDREHRPDRNSTAPAPALLQAAELQLPATIATVLMPFPPGSAPATDCRWDGETLEVSVPGAANLSVRFEDGAPVGVSEE